MPDLIVETGESVRVECYQRNAIIFWAINGSNLVGDFSNGLLFERRSEPRPNSNGSQLQILTFVPNMDYDGITITCFTSQNEGPKVIKQYKVVVQGKLYQNHTKSAIMAAI